jgi:4'-phosphopantetheinyl transferase EntD
MIEQILPTWVAVSEARHDPGEALLLPEEQVLLAGAVEKRRREFATGRMCARAALEQLGCPAVPILGGSHGEPLWPKGVVGSITHCDGYRAAAVASSTQVAVVGIDAEPHWALPEGLLGRIARAEEQVALGRLGSEWPQVHWDKLLFSAKESVYKAWFPFSGRGLGSKDISIAFDPLARTFAVRLMLPRPVPDGPPRELCGGWRVCEGLVLTAVVG